MNHSAPPIPRRISEHGVIGNMTTLALVALDGTIDFLCWPMFDSPSIFAGLLDPERGGAFAISPQLADARVVQSYLPETNVLLTRWLGEAASVEVVDLLTAPGQGRSRLIRRLRVTRGSVRVDVRCDPRFDYARVQPQIAVESGNVDFLAPGMPELRLHAEVPFVDEGGAAVASVSLRAGDVRDFVLDDASEASLARDEITTMIDESVRHWQAWSKRTRYQGRWRGAVTRSALVLKLLTSSQHGSIAAAGTFGLPETPGGERNWDYRATWIRDASFTVYGLMRLGHTEEAIAFTRWASQRAEECPEGRLQVMYAMDGGPVSREAVLEQFAGYGGARPVRIGNAAVEQVQVDIYGALLDSIYLSNKYGEAISHDDWRGISRVVDYVCDHWREPDSGIWEKRSTPAEHLHSRLMCWVAVDRGLRLAEKRSLLAPATRWRETRDAINHDIWENFWDVRSGHFVSRKGTDELDGSLLMMPLVRFVSASDPKWLATVDAIGTTLADGGLVIRYAGDDGLDGEEGSFAACAFWYVECLARAGRIDEARVNFERLLSYANHLDLYAEEFSVTAELRGNFPQALTHLALISAATYLDRAIDHPDDQEWRA